MRSIPMAMTWELYRRGRWTMLLAAVGANALPVILLTALSLHGGVDPAEPAMASVQFILIPLQIFCFGAAVLQATELTPRSFVLPISTAGLVAGKMIPGMVAIAIETFVSMQMLNGLFGVGWPVWSPTLLAPVAYGMIVASYWYAERSPWLPWSVGIAALTLGVWYKVRCCQGSLLQVSSWTAPPVMWTTITTGDIFLMLMLGLASFRLAVAGVARSRHGETLKLSRSLEAGWESLAELANRRVVVDRRFHSAVEAQFWCEWQKKGRLLPAVVMYCSGFWGMCWLLFSREPWILFDGFLIGAPLLSAVGMLIGLLIGNCGPTDTRNEMGSFLGSRPLTDRQLSDTILKVAARTVILSWAQWLGLTLLVAGLVWASQSSLRSEILGKLSWWYLPVTLLGCWTVISGAATIGLSGRTELWARFVTVAIVLAVAGNLLSISLDQGSRDVLSWAVMLVIGIAISMLTCWVMMLAKQRSVISPIELSACGIVWLSFCVALLGQKILTESMSIPFTVLLMGASSLAVAPLAAAPLAVSWNRHR